MREEVDQRGNAHVTIDQRVVVDDRPNKALDLMAERVIVRQHEHSLLAHARNVLGKQCERSRFPAAGASGEAHLARAQRVFDLLESTVRDRGVGEAVDRRAIARRNAALVGEDVAEGLDCAAIGWRRVGKEDALAGRGSLQHIRPGSLAPNDVCGSGAEFILGHVGEPAQAVDEWHLVGVALQEVFDSDDAVLNLLANRTLRTCATVDWKNLRPLHFERFTTLLLHLDGEETAGNRGFRRCSAVAQANGGNWTRVRKRYLNRQVDLEHQAHAHEDSHAVRVRGLRQVRPLGENEVSQMLRDWQFVFRR